MDTTTPNNSGKFIVIEGLPGSGKDIQIELLARRLHGAGNRVQLFSGLFYNLGSSLKAVFEAKARGEFCLSPTNFLTPLIQQYYRAGAISNYTELITQLGANTPDNADAVFVLDVPPSQILERLKAQGSNTAIGIPELEKMRAGYLWEAKQRGYTVIDALASTEIIQNQIWNMVSGEHTPSTPSTDQPQNNAPSQSQTHITNDVPRQANTSNASTHSDITPIAKVLNDRSKNLQPAVTHQAKPTPQAKPRESASTPSLQLEGISYLAASRLQASLGPRIVSFLPSPMQHRQNTFYMPQILSPEQQNTYRTRMSELLNVHAKIVTGLTSYLQTIATSAGGSSKDQTAPQIERQAYEIAKTALPLASFTGITISLGLGSYQNIGSQFAKDNIEELQQIGKKLPSAFEFSAALGLENSKDTLIERFAETNLSQQLGSLDEDVRLITYSPRNELALLGHILYSSSAMGLPAISQELQRVPYDQKAALLSHYASQPANSIPLTGDALREASYTWDIMSDFTTMLSIAQDMPGAQVMTQDITPRYGFEIPELIEQAGLGEQYEQCFDISAALFSVLQTDETAKVAQYAALLGHRTRWKLTVTARELSIIYSRTNQPYDYAKNALYKSMQENLSTVHPLLSEAFEKQYGT